MQPQPKPEPLTGHVGSIHIFGVGAETSHTCQVKMTLDNGEGRLLLLAFNDANYRSMLGALLSARLGHCQVSLAPDLAHPSYIQSVSVQKMLAAQASANKAEPPPIDTKALPSNLVQSMDAGNNTSRSSFKLASGETIWLDSINAPKRSSAMMQLVAAAFGAGEKIVVATAEDGSGVAKSVEIAP